MRECQKVLLLPTCHTKVVSEKHTTSGGNDDTDKQAGRDLALVIGSTSGSIACSADHASAASTAPHGTATCVEAGDWQGLQTSVNLTWVKCNSGSLSHDRLLPSERPANAIRGMKR